MFITFFETNILFQRVGISWIIESNEELKFYVQEHFPNWMCDVPWYNSTMCSPFHGYSFEHFFRICAIDMYKNIHPTEPYNASSGGGRPMQKIQQQMILHLLVLHWTSSTTAFNVLSQIIQRE